MARKHDELFKHTFGDPQHAADALRGMLPPPLAAAVDWSTLEVCAGSFVDEALASRHTDLLYRASIRGRPSLIYLLFEHQSRADPLMPLRVVEYLTRIWRARLEERPRLRRLPPVVPIVLYNGAKPWRAPTRLSALYALDRPLLDGLRDLLPEATFILHDLGRTDDAQLRERFSAVVALVLGSLKHSQSPDALFDWLQRSVELMRRLLAARTQIQALEAVFRYAFSADLTPERLRPLVVDHLGPEAPEVLMTVLDRLMAQGIEQGLEQGITRGRAQMRREFLERLLALRFGLLDEETLERARALDDARVEALCGHLLSPDFAAPSIDSVLADPPEQG